MQKILVMLAVLATLITTAMASSYEQGFKNGAKAISEDSHFLESSKEYKSSIANAQSGVDKYRAKIGLETAVKFGCKRLLGRDTYNGKETKYFSGFTDGCYAEASNIIKSTSR